MNPNIYQGLQVEPPNPDRIPVIKLRGKVISDTQFAFIPEYWEAALKPFSKAKWTHGHDSSGHTANYGIKSGAYLVFREFKPIAGGLYAAHLYMIVKELKDLLKRAEFQRVDGTFTEEGLALNPCEATDGIRTKFLLKWRTIQTGDTPHHIVIN